jgi:hypothetical protein
MGKRDKTRRANQVDNTYVSPEHGSRRANQIDSTYGTAEWAAHAMAALASPHLASLPRRMSSLFQGSPCC